MYLIIFFKNAQNQGLLQGLGRFDNIGPILNLHFADDTLLFLEADKDYIEALKWIFIAFENLSGLKINYDKCDLIPLNISEEKGQDVANFLGCKLSSLPILYLGVPLSGKALNKKDWNFLIDKIEKKIKRLARFSPIYWWESSSSQFSLIFCSLVLDVYI